ncbi:hypothetical protein NFI96_018603 [Prochilodus magdalenae]|nr:hypothetical protein NFI96_018603 [Prochilodus magdalenae]
MLIMVYFGIDDAPTPAKPDAAPTPAKPGYNDFKFESCALSDAGHLFYCNSLQLIITVPTDKAPPKTADDGFDLSDAFGPDPTKAPKKPAGDPSKTGGTGDFNIFDAVDNDPKKPVPPKHGAKSSLFKCSKAVVLSKEQRRAVDPSYDTDAPQGGQMAGIISAVGVAILGAASSYFAYQKKKLCFKIQGEAHQAFVTLATTDAYCKGTLVVGKCLRRHGTTRKLVVMISTCISREMRVSLEEVFDEVLVVDVLDSRDSAHLSWLRRPDLGVTFTKIHCWTLAHYTKCVFLDADTLVLCNVDELFEREELSAAPDPGWPDCFNSGVFVFRPSLDTYLRLLEYADLHGSFDGGDQGLLNSFFSDWATKDINKHLPFIYNLSANALYTYLPAFHKYGHQAKIVHFLGGTKPWNFTYNQQQSSGVPPWDSSQNLKYYVNLWWEEYYSQTDQHRQQPLAALQTAPQPESQETDFEAQSCEKETLSQSHGDLTLNVPSSSSCHQLEEMMVNELASCDQSDTEEAESSELRDSPSDQAEEDTETESADQPTVSEPDTAAVESDDERRRQWEEGRADYLGKDAFENIQKKLNQFLS